MASSKPTPKELRALRKGIRLYVRYELDIILQPVHYFTGGADVYLETRELIEEARRAHLEIHTKPCKLCDLIRRYDAARGERKETT